MIKIIKIEEKTPEPNKTYIRKCKCGCEFSYETEDIKLCDYPDIWSVKCPKCKDHTCFSSPKE